MADVDDGREMPDDTSRAVLPDEADVLATSEELEDQPTPRDLAVAAAERHLDGPALRPTVDAPSPADLEATWSDEALDAMELLRADLGGRRVGLAISGGGSLGSFEAGVLRFLYDHAAVAPVAVAGNSAGGLNAAKLAEGDRVDGPRAVDEVERLWRSMRINGDMWEPEPWLVRLQASASWASAMRGHLTEGASGTNAVRVAARVVASLVRRPPETDGALDAARDALTAQSLLSLDPVAELLERELDPDRVAASGIALRVGAVSLESGELHYVTETGERHDRHDRPIGAEPVPLRAGVLASASIPVAFPPVPLGGEHYVDGGAREILPIEILVHHHQVDRVIAICAGAVGVAPKASFADRNIIDILRRVSAEIGPDETLRKELAPPGGWAETVRAVVPEFDVHDSMTIDPALIAISIDHGWLRAADVLLDLGPEARRLTRELTETRVRLRRLGGPLATLFGGDASGHEEADEVAPEELVALLRQQVGARRDLGAPLPPTLVAWLDAPPTPDPEATPAPVAQLGAGEPVVAQLGPGEDLPPPQRRAPDPPAPPSDDVGDVGDVGTVSRA